MQKSDVQSYINQFEFPVLDINVIKRNGTLVPFRTDKIAIAITKAFFEVGDNVILSDRFKVDLKSLVDNVIKQIHLTEQTKINIEDIQDIVEKCLMLNGFYDVAKSYISYRADHNKKRVTNIENEKRFSEIKEKCSIICKGLEVDQELLFNNSVKNLYKNIKDSEILDILLLNSKILIERNYNFSYVSSRLILIKLYNEALKLLKLNSSDEFSILFDIKDIYSYYFDEYMKYGVEHGFIDKRLLDFDFEKIKPHIIAENDLKFGYIGIQTVYDRYLLRKESVRFELPQAFFMRVAMGLALNEKNKEEKAVEFYKLYSSFDFMSSTPTLFNSGTNRPQMSSCFLTTIPDDLDGIFGAIKDNALLQKWAGGLGNDWTAVRGRGSLIKGTNGQSQGIVPFMKVANDTLVAVNQGGKRKGSGCAYLETWHIDIDEFLELRKNTGDDRRRTHDMNTANWIPDLFMKRVENKENWTLFSPDEVPDLHEKYGKDFERAYVKYEELAESGEIKIFKKVSAVGLWRKMLTMLFETGHPWVTFKDPCNIRNPQQHVGVVHSSNLCTEITLNTKANEEIAVCNLGSINVSNHIVGDRIDSEKLKKTIDIAIRMLDNVIDLNYYVTDSTKTSNFRHRPIGLGLMGFQDALYKLRIPYDSEDAIRFSDNLMESISYYAISASCDLSKERGTYDSFNGSLWSKGILPIDSIKLLETERETDELDASYTLNWDYLRTEVVKYGLRNSNCMAIAPTVTISNICDVSQSIEPTFQNLYVKSNLSGEFIIMNKFLVEDLKRIGLWDSAMINDLKYHDGILNNISRIPNDIKDLYKTSFEINPITLVKCAAKRQKWIDQAQSLNLYMANQSGKKLDELYMTAWKLGLKTTYYLRSKAATQVEKNTISTQEPSGQVCNLENGECESCQ
jgi:ribonucleoside-diphosphate reductase alpha chain